MLNIAATTASAAVQPAATPQPRLVRAAHEFEAQMMKELLKPINGDDAMSGEDQDAGLGSGAGSGSALGEFASEALGKAMSEQGGFGVASHIIKALSHSGNSGVPSSVTAGQNGNTVMKAFK